MDQTAEAIPEKKECCCKGCPKHLGLCLAILFAMLTGWSVMGTHILNPLDTGWLKEDQAEIYLGWAFLRQDPQWHFPLSYTNRLSYPTGAPAAYSGAMPLIAVPLKLISAWLPADFQYLGLYSMLCFLLQGIFAYKLCKRFIGDDFLAALGSFFFILAPPFIFRMVGHFDLIAQWIILAAFWLYFAPERGKPFSRPLIYGLLLALAGGISPYLSIMCLMVTALDAARDTLLNRPFQWVRVAAWCIPPAIMLASWITFGFLEIGKKGDDYAGFGYRWFSMNMLSPVNPEIIYTDIHSIFFTGPPVGDGQYEGYNYLGAGILLMILVALLAWRGIFKEITRPVYVPLWTLTLVCYLLALSPTVMFGSRTLMTLPLPVSVETALSTFRSSGRLFWPAYYFIFLFFIQFIAKKFPRRVAVCILGALLCIQIADTQSLRTRVFDTHGLRDPSASIFKNTFWTSLKPRFDKIIVLPAWQSSQRNPTLPGGRESWMHFGLLAASQGMTTNTCYLGRNRSVDVETQTVTLPAAVRAGNLESDAVYVLHPAYLATFIERQYTHISGRIIDGMLVFWKDPSSSPANLENLNAMLDTVLAGDLDLQQIASGFEDVKVPIPYSPATGFEMDDEKDIHSDGARSEIAVFNPQMLAGGKITVDLGLYFEDGAPQNFSVALGGIPLGEFSVKEDRKLVIDVPRDAFANLPSSTRVAQLVFEWKTAVPEKWIFVGLHNAGLRAVRIHALRFEVGE